MALLGLIAFLIAAIDMAAAMLGLPFTSEAYRSVEEIRGVADAKATEIYASAHNQSLEAVEFYEFTRTMQSYKSIIADNTTLVLSTDSDLFKFLSSMANGVPGLPVQRAAENR